jgi:oligoribonuclease (3'-5' exoribonuclease)
MEAAPPLVWIDLEMSGLDPDTLRDPRDRHHHHRW